MGGGGERVRVEDARRAVKEETRTSREGCVGQEHGRERKLKKEL